MAASLGQRIKAGRAAHRMMQRDLAVAAGITVSYLSKIEGDKETPIEEKIVTIAGILGLDPDELILSAGRMPADVMERLTADPGLGLEFLRQMRA